MRITEPNLTDDERAIVDTLALIGLQRNDNTYFTIIDDDVGIQMLYSFIKPVVDYRSIDDPDDIDGKVLTLRFNDRALGRMRQWPQDSILVVPEEFTTNDRGIELLFRINGTHTPCDDGMKMEVQTPPMDEESAQRIRERLSMYGLDLTGGIGVEHFEICDDDRDIEDFISNV